jgi:hypothetical protein
MCCALIPEASGFRTGQIRGPAMLGHGRKSPDTNAPELICEQISVQAQQYDKTVHDETRYQLIALISLKLMYELKRV